MTQVSNEENKLRTNRFKRLPSNSHTIILQFNKQKDRNKCISSDEFKQIFAELATLLINYNSSIEIIKWDSLTGQTKKN